MSGWLLLACLFLPTLRVCNDPMMPIQFPPTYGVYLGGAFVAVIGFTTLRRRRRQMLIALQALYLVTLFTLGAIWVGSMANEVAGVVAGVGFFALFATLMRRSVSASWSERVVAGACFVHAIVAAGWSTLLAFDPNGMWGAQVSLAAASLMLFAAGGYLAYEVMNPSERAAEEPLPEARML